MKRERFKKIIEGDKNVDLIIGLLIGVIFFELVLFISAFFTKSSEGEIEAGIYCNIFMIILLMIVFFNSRKVYWEKVK